MRRILGVFFLALIFAMGAGCAGKMTTTLTPPENHAVVDSRIFNKPYDTVWKAVVQSIGSSFFVLDNIEKDSGILTLSFSTQDAGDYIDCGFVHKSGTVQMEKQNFTYPGTANNYAYRDVWDNGVPVQILRKCSLSGKANILVQRLGANETKVSVKTRYIFSLANTVQPNGGFPQNFDVTMQFTGSEVGTFDARDSIQCRAKGTLEKLILDDIAKQL